VNPLPELCWGPAYFGIKLRKTLKWRQFHAEITDSASLELGTKHRKALNQGALNGSSGILHGWTEYLLRRQVVPGYLLRRQVVPGYLLRRQVVPGYLLRPVVPGYLLRRQVVPGYLLRRPVVPGLNLDMWSGYRVLEANATTSTSFPFIILWHIHPVVGNTQLHTIRY
jgi:hypothetical protein